jgi:hypothetical protein
VAIRVVVKEQFAPGSGGSAFLTINKDRHGGLRRHCPPNPGREQVAGLFTIAAGTDDIVWSVSGPEPGQTPAHERVDAADLAVLDLLDPAPISVRDVKRRCQWSTARAMGALKEWRSRRSAGVPREQGTLPDGVPRERGTDEANAQVDGVPLIPSYVSGNEERTHGAGS